MTHLTETSGKNYNKNISQNKSAFYLTLPVYLISHEVDLK